VAVHKTTVLNSSSAAVSDTHGFWAHHVQCVHTRLHALKLPHTMYIALGAQVRYTQRL
jgi:hypothetical protein